jgi:hypothetical protein
MTIHITVEPAGWITVIVFLFLVFAFGYVWGVLHGIRTAEKRFGERFLNDDKNDNGTEV